MKSYCKDSTFSLVISWELQRRQSLVPWVYQYPYVRWVKKKISINKVKNYLTDTPPPPPKVSTDIAISWILIATITVIWKIEYHDSPNSDHGIKPFNALLAMHYPLRIYIYIIVMVRWTSIIRPSYTECLHRAIYSEQDKLACDRNAIKALVEVGSSARDVQTTCKLRAQTWPTHLHRP